SIKQSFGEIKVDNKKCFNIVLQLVNDDKDYDLINNICRCVSLCKGLLIDTPSQIDKLIDEFGIDALDFERKEFINLVIKTLSECKQIKSVVDFDDMIWFPFVYRLN